MNPILKTVVDTATRVALQGAQLGVASVVSQTLSTRVNRWLGNQPATPAQTFDSLKNVLSE